MKLLVTGAKGQLGTELRRCLDIMTTEIGSIPQEYSGADVVSIDYEDLDIADESAVKLWFDKKNYDVIINCAAFTNVDECEIREDVAYAVNALGARNLARAAAAQGSTIVHISTDYVFAGDDSRPRREDDSTGPISAYGRTKLAGEMFVQEECSRYFICRTAWLYGLSGRNFVKTMRRLGRDHDEIAVVNDQWGNPTSANDLVYEILRLALTGDYGVYHMTNEGICSWAEFAARIMEKSGLDCRVVPVTSEEYKAANPQSANRPHYSSLENARLAATIGNEMRPWEEALDDFIIRLNEVERKVNMSTALLE